MAGLLSPAAVVSSAFAVWPLVAPCSVCLIDVGKQAGEVLLRGQAGLATSGVWFCLGLSVTGESLSIVAHNPLV